MADGSTCTQASDTTGVAATETLTLSAQMGQTYFIVVDSSVKGPGGPFVLSLQ
jgi:hypothetical protein